MDKLSWKFQPLYQDSNLLGHEFRSSNAVVFFGSRYASQDFCENFSRLVCGNSKIHFLNQKHTNLVVAAGEQSQEADAHWSSTLHVPVGVFTADCIPLILVAEGVVMATHAGWRGVSGGIVENSVETLKNMGPLKNVKAFIGPHICGESFEVHQDVGEELRKSSPTALKFKKKHEDPNKVFIDLEEILINKLLHSGFQKENLVSLKIDTFSNSNYFSYRRDGKTGNRLVSFVTLI